jgi:hypothetical protein
VIYDLEKAKYRDGNLLQEQDKEAKYREFRG